MSLLSITRKTANTLITASGFNSNFAEIEAVANALEADNLSADCITAVKLNVDCVRADYGLKQHTDGSLYVDVSDTTPGLELSDGGLRVKSYGLNQRTANGLEVGRTGDLFLSSAASTPDGWSDISATYEGKMIRISATALSSGGSDTASITLSEANLPIHTHPAGTLVTPFASSQGGTIKAPEQTSGSNIIAGNTIGVTGSTGSTGSGTAITVATVPAYITSKMFMKN